MSLKRSNKMQIRFLAMQLVLLVVLVVLMGCRGKQDVPDLSKKFEPSSADLSDIVKKCTDVQCFHLDTCKSAGDPELPYILK